MTGGGGAFQPIAYIISPLNLGTTKIFTTFVLRKILIKRMKKWKVLCRHCSVCNSLRSGIYAVRLFERYGVVPK